MLLSREQRLILCEMLRKMEEDVDIQFRTYIHPFKRTNRSTYMMCFVHNTSCRNSSRHLLLFKWLREEDSLSSRNRSAMFNCRSAVRSKRFPFLIAQDKIWSSILSWHHNSPVLFLDYYWVFQYCRIYHHQCNYIICIIRKN